MVCNRNAAALYTCDASFGRGCSHGVCVQTCRALERRLPAQCTLAACESHPSSPVCNAGDTRHLIQPKDKVLHCHESWNATMQPTRTGHVLRRSFDPPPYWLAGWLAALSVFAGCQTHPWTSATQMRCQKITVRAGAPITAPRKRQGERCLKVTLLGRRRHLQ